MTLFTPAQKERVRECTETSAPGPGVLSPEDSAPFTPEQRARVLGRDGALPSEGRAHLVQRFAPERHGLSSGG